MAHQKESAFSDAGICQQPDGHDHCGRHMNDNPDSLIYRVEHIISIQERHVSVLLWRAYCRKSIIASIFLHSILRFTVVDRAPHAGSA